MKTITVTDLMTEHEWITKTWGVEGKQRTPPLNNSVDTPMMSLLKNLHSTQRVYHDTKFFGKSSRVCLLDFIGAPDFFIAEQGTVWCRNRIYPNKLRRLTKEYLPLAVMDSRFPYPWVKIPCCLNSVEGAWIPVNLLLGWAFNPIPLINKFYAISLAPGYQPMSAKQLYWSTTPSLTPAVSVLPSRYLSFMDTLYENIEPAVLYF